MIDEQRGDRQSELRVLVVEDEALVALVLEDIVTELGHRIIGTASSVNVGLEIAQQQEIDIAILDLSLKGGSSLPIAQALSARGIPVVFSTGYGRGGLPEAFKDAPLLQKPFQQLDVEKVIAQATKATGW